MSDKIRLPLLRQLAHLNGHALGDDAKSSRSDDLRPRTERAKQVVPSICPYCAVGCGQRVYVEEDARGHRRISDIEGDPDSPISGGCLCPKGAATFQLVTGTHRPTEVLYRRPGGTAWETLPLDVAMDMVAARVKRTRDETFVEKDEKGNPAKHTLGIAHLGGATLDNEENYVLKKLYTALGVVQVENQARI